jgi:predicted ribosomally synthesized peptide with nif11-like leader
MASNTLTVNQAEEFIAYLKNKPHELKKLRDATEADIVQAGKDAGFDFTESDLASLIQRITVTGTSTARPPEMGWGGVGADPNPCH